MLEELKQYLHITWGEEDVDLLKLIERGKRYLENKTGTSLNFEEDDDPKELLFNYCRYARNNSLEYFEGNFSSEILSLALREAVKEMNANAEAQG